eukprot:363696-Chlamydomonas_euryale.AAC.3
MAVQRRRAEDGREHCSDKPRNGERGAAEQFAREGARAAHQGKQTLRVNMGVGGLRDGGAREFGGLSVGARVGTRRSSSHTREPAPHVRASKQCAWQDAHQLCMDRKLSCAWIER